MLLENEEVKKYFSILFFLVLSCNILAQQTSNSEDIKLYYRSSSVFGVTAHSAGFGIGYKFNRHLSYKVKRFYQIEIQNLKHPKQEKIKNIVDDNSRGFFYGKTNHLINTRWGIGRQNAFALKEIKKGVQVAFIYSAGLNIGLLKPIYLQVSDPNQGNAIVVERYDPNKHNFSNIYGGASFFYGVSEMQFVPGAFGKFGLNFEYSPYDEKLRSLETGVAFDIFYKEVPMMYNTYNNQYWITFYVMYEFGKKRE